MQILIHSFKIIQHVSVGISNDFNSMFVEVFSPVSIVLFLLCMSIAIDLDCKHQFRTIKIYNVFIQWFLAGEFQIV